MSFFGFSVVVGPVLCDTMSWAYVYGLSIAHGDLSVGLSFVCVALSAWFMVLSWWAAQSPYDVGSIVSSVVKWAYFYRVTAFCYLHKRGALLKWI